MPKRDVVFQRITQNTFFLIDRSNSIRYTRYDASKQAVLDALQILREGDTFNVLIFDSRIVRLSEKNLPWNAENIAKAKAFLVSQSDGGLFATTDLYSSLGQIVPQAVAETEVNTAILLSDGDTYLSRSKQRNTIREWTRRNSGKVSLYSIASGIGNNLALLDLLSTLNKGRLTYAKTDQEIGGVLLKLMKSIQNPIGKDIVITAISSDANVHIMLYPTASHLPNFYEHLPYKIYGSTNQLQDFYLFIQGKYYNKWFDIKLPVSFKNAKRVDDFSLEKIWAKQKAYDSYENYLSTGKESFLQEARQSLAPFQIPVAFQ